MDRRFYLPEMPLGFHLSTAGGLIQTLRRAEELGCETIQIFSRNPRGWRAGSIDPVEAMDIREALQERGIYPLILHSSYLINLATEEEGLYRRSLEALKEDIERAHTLGAPFLVTHIGSTKGGERRRGIERVMEALEEIEVLLGRDARLLLENSSGSGSHIGGSMEEIGEILAPFRGEGRIGFCLDTCHAFAAGYPIHTTRGLSRLLSALNDHIGQDHLHLIHLNDSRTPLGSRVDRHEHIGRGGIGIRGFRAILNHPLLRDLPMIMETPKEREGDDDRNMRVVRALMESLK